MSAAEFSANPEQIGAKEAEVYKGAVFLKALYEMTKTPTGRAVTAGGKMAAENIKLMGMGAISPSAQGVVLTSVMIRKAMHMAGIAEPSQGIRCVTATAKLTSTVAVVSAKVGATTAVSLGTLAIPTVFIGLAVVALESYNVGTACFVRDGRVSHAL